jgi:hypothetical protein
MASLRELQYSFAAALRDPTASCPVSPAANLDVYRNNGESHFRGVLETSFPVLRRRVGDDYFRQLAHHYRQAHPSRSGDLLWIGREFADFLAGHLRGSEYEWLADLARLEWLRELSLIAEARPALGPEVLARYPAEELERLVFTLQPSLHLLASPFPVFSIWQANQRENAPPVDQSRCGEQGMILGRDDGTYVQALPAPHFSYLLALAEGKPLGEAVSVAGLDEAGLLQALQLLFAESLVCAVSPPLQP